MSDEKLARVIRCMNAALRFCYHGVERHGICFLLPEGGIERHRDRFSSILLFSAALPAIKCLFLSYMYIPFVCKSVPSFEFTPGCFVIDIEKYTPGMPYALDSIKD